MWGTGTRIAQTKLCKAAAVKFEANGFLDATVDGCTFEDNRSEGLGGGIYATGQKTLPGMAEDVHATERAHTHDSSGGPSYAEITVKNSAFRGNSATKGGGLYVAEHGHVVISGEPREPS